MPDIARTHAAIVECHAGASALDSMPPLLHTHPCRVAPDELLLVGPPHVLADTLGAAAAHLAAAEPGTLVLDQSDAWAVFTIRGDDAMIVLRQLSANPFPEERPAFVQGAVAGGAAKVLLVAGAAYVLVPYVLRDNLAERLRDVCGPAVTIPTDEVPLGVSAPALPAPRVPTMVER